MCGCARGELARRACCRTPPARPSSTRSIGTSRRPLPGERVEIVPRGGELGGRDDLHVERRAARQVDALNTMRRAGIGDNEHAGVRLDVHAALRSRTNRIDQWSRFSVASSARAARRASSAQVAVTSTRWRGGTREPACSITTRAAARSVTFRGLAPRTPWPGHPEAWPRPADARRGSRTASPAGMRGCGDLHVAQTSPTAALSSNIPACRTYERATRSDLCSV